MLRGFSSHLICALSLMAVSCCMSAQLPVFNADFELMPLVQTKGELADALRLMGVVDRTYEIRGVKVIEYYEMNTRRFLGFAGDTTQFDIRRLPYLSRTPTMRRLVRHFGPAIAHDIRQGLLVEGIQQKDVMTIHGWPRKRKREGGRTLWTYDDRTLTFSKGVLVTIHPQ